MNWQEYKAHREREREAARQRAEAEVWTAGTGVCVRCSSYDSLLNGLCWRCVR